MPHSTSDMSQPLQNGEPAKNSKFLAQLTSYPVVSDAVETVKSNSYGKKSLELADNAYNRFGKPVEPYLETPYSYAKPYVTKADELASNGLGKVETHFPIVKEDTNTIVDYGKSFVYWPFKVAGEGRDYVLNTWTDEYDKTAKHKDRGQGFSTLILALISTELKIASDFFQAVADYLGPKYEESKKNAPDSVKQALETAEQYKDSAADKLQEYGKLGQQKAEEYQKFGQQKAEEAQKVGQEKGEQAKQEAQKTKEEAQRKMQK